MSIFKIILAILTGLPAVCYGKSDFAKYIDYEHERYVGFSEQIAEFNHVVTLLNEIRSNDYDVENLAFESGEAFPVWVDPYICSMRYFYSGDSRLLACQEYGMSFSHMWLFPYAEDSSLKSKAFVACLDFLSKLSKQIASGSDADSIDLELSGAIFEAANQIDLLTQSICDESPEMIIVFTNALQRIKEQLNHAERIVDGKALHYFSGKTARSLASVLHACKEKNKELRAYYKSRIEGQQINSTVDISVVLKAGEILNIK